MREKNVLKHKLLAESRGHGDLKAKGELSANQTYATSQLRVFPPAGEAPCAAQASQQSCKRSRRPNPSVRATGFRRRRPPDALRGNG